MVGVVPLKGYNMITIRTDKGVQVNTHNYGRMFLPKVWDTYTTHLNQRSEQVSEITVLNDFGIWLANQIEVPS